MVKKGKMKFTFVQTEEGDLEVEQVMEHVGPKMLLGAVQCIVNAIMDGMEEVDTLKVVSEMSKLERIEATYDSLKEMHTTQQLFESREQPSKEDLLYMLDKLTKRVQEDM